MEIPLFSRNSRYSPNVVQFISYFMSPCCLMFSFFISSFKGPLEPPSPKTSRVTPWRISLWELPSSINEVVAQLSILIKPGETAIPSASISTPPVAVSKLPMAAILSPVMPTSPLYGAFPVPSYMTPFRIITS